MRELRNKTAKQMLRLLHENGWYAVNQEGSHCELKHPDRPGRVTVPIHTGTLSAKVIASILRQAGLSRN